MPKVTLPNFTPHPGQRAILSNKRQRMVACMGRRWGKTASMTEDIVNYPGGALAGVDGKGNKGLPTAWYAPNTAISKTWKLSIRTRFRLSVFTPPSSVRS